jgi:hypothetical protein
LESRQSTADSGHGMILKQSWRRQSQIVTNSSAQRPI